MSIQESRKECALLRAKHGGADDKGEGGYESANRITTGDRTIISRYFEGRGSLASVTRPAGSSKLRRRWIIGAKLPATLRTGALPRQLDSKLSALEAGYERLLVGCDVLCVELSSHRIVDVMHNDNAGAPEVQDTPQLLLDGAGDPTAANAAGGTL